MMNMVASLAPTAWLLTKHMYPEKVSSSLYIFIMHITSGKTVAISFCVRINSFNDKFRAGGLVDVTLGRGVDVDVDVGGTVAVDVAVGGGGVAVGVNVAVGGSAVAVGSDVAVGGSGVAVGTAVAVGISVGGIWVVVQAERITHTSTKANRDDGIFSPTRDLLTDEA